MFGILHDMLVEDDLPVHNNQQSLGWGLLYDETMLVVVVDVVVVAVVACDTVAVALGC